MRKRKKKQEPVEETAVDEAVDAEAGAEAEAPAAPGADPAAEWREKYMRTLAELDNYRKRVERDREQSRRYANEQLMRALLPVLDGLQCAAETEGGDADAFRQGVELALKDALRVLHEHGLEVIEAEGKQFDPRWHEAMGMAPDPDKPPGTVLAELRKGYKLGDRVLRASRVQISVQPPPPAPPAEQREEEPEPEKESSED